MGAVKNGNHVAEDAVTLLSGPGIFTETISFELPGPRNGRGVFMRESALTSSLDKRILQNKENVKR
jgi:hypothetical protein